MSTEQVMPLESEESMLVYAQSKRKDFIEQILKLEKGVPAKASGQKVLFDALNQMETTALGRMRIKVDDKQAANTELAAKLIASVLTGIHGKTINGNSNVIIPNNYKAPSLPEHIAPPILVPGEIDSNAGHEDYDSFIARMNEE